MLESVDVVAVRPTRAPHAPVRWVATALTKPLVVQPTSVPVSKPPLAMSSPALATVTVIGGDAPGLPDVSYATATSWWLPSEACVVSHAAVYGAAGDDATTAPSTVKSTRTTPVSSLAVAASWIVPVTVAPLAGAVSVAVGGWQLAGSPAGIPGQRTPAQLCTSNWR